MDWELYQTQYFDFLEAINRSTIISLIGSTILEDLPQNLPPSIKDAFSHDLDIIKKQIEDSLSQARTIPPSEQSACSIEFGYDPTKFKSEVSFALFSFIFVRGWSEKEVD